jgi:hypothetical protein
VIWLVINVMAIPRGGHATELFVLATAAILLPTFIAGIRRHENRLAIFVLCLLQIGILTLAAASGGLLMFVPALFIAGALFIIALVWSCTSNCESVM